MSIFTSPRVRDIPASKWAIPVPTETPGIDYRDGWMSRHSREQVEQFLQDMGFEQASSQVGFSPYAFKDGVPRGAPLRRSIWVHPAGALLDFKCDASDLVEGMELVMEIDLGVYGRTRSMNLGQGGGGSSEPQTDGRSHACKYWNFNQNTLYSLSQTLSAVQKAGRIVPFTRWTTGEINVASAFPLEALIVIDPQQAAGKPEKDVRAMVKRETLAAIGAHLGKWPGLKEMATALLVDDRINEKKVSQGFHDKTWWRAENAMDYCRRAMMHAKIRWPNQAASKRTSQWLELIAWGQIGELDAKKPLLVSPGPGGTRFLTCLALELGRDQGMEKFSKLFDSMSDDQARDWAGSVDSQGNTPFGEMVMSLITQTSSFLPDTQQIVSIFEKVSSRIGVQACPVMIGGKKPWLVFEDAVKASQKPGGTFDGYLSNKFIMNTPGLLVVLSLLEDKGCADVALEDTVFDMLNKLLDQEVNHYGDRKKIKDMLPPGLVARASQVKMEKAVAKVSSTPGKAMGRL